VSFAYLPLFTGDYLRDTRMLSPLKHGVYLLLLMYCWDTKSPVPLEEQDAAGIANCRSTDEIDALRYVLGKYFTRMEDGWYNERMQNEIATAEFVSKKRSDAGKKGAEARVKHSRIKKLRQLPSKSQASAEQLPVPPTPYHTNPNPFTTPTKITAAVRNFELPDWVPRDAWLGWEEMRRKIRKPLTDAARTVNLRKLTKLRDRGEDPTAVLEQSIANAYAGLFEVRPDRSERKALSKREIAELFPATEEDDQTP
jgi:uncharacterized protein YdaU (DUF1376 family)